MNEVTQWTGGGTLEPRRPSRSLKGDSRSIVENARKTALELDALAAVYGRAMERAVDLDNHRSALASNNPELDAVLVRLELGFVSAVESKLRSHTSRFGF